MRRFLSRNALKRATLAAAALVLSVLCVLCLIPQWAPLSSRNEEVDLNSGRVRYTRYLLSFQVGETVEESWLSRSGTPPLGPPDWRRANTLSSGTDHSPHYVYHSAIAQIETLERLDGLVRFDPAARAQVGGRILQLWREGSDDAAEQYLKRISDVVVSLHERSVRKLLPHHLP